jgi:hypothetical protein
MDRPDKPGDDEILNEGKLGRFYPAIFVTNVMAT